MCSFVNGSDGLVPQVLQQNGMWAKQSADEANNLFKALSNALYLTSTRAAWVRKLLTLHFLNNLESFLSLHDFPSLEAVDHFLLHPLLPQYQRLLFHVAASTFRVQVKVSYLHQDTLCTDYFGPKGHATLKVFRVYDGHFSAVFRAERAVLLGVAQNIVLNLVEFALAPKTPRKWRNFNNNTYRDFELEGWQRSFSVRQGHPDAFRPTTVRPETSQIGKFLLRVMHLRPHTDPPDLDDCGGVKIQALVRSPSTRRVILWKLHAHSQQQEEEERRARFQIEMDYERLLAVEFDRLPSALHRHSLTKDTQASPAPEEGFSASNEVEEDDSDLFEPFLRRDNFVDQVSPDQCCGEGFPVSQDNSRKQSADVPSQDADPLAKPEAGESQPQKKAKSKLVFRKTKEFTLPQPSGPPSELLLVGSPEFAPEDDPRAAPDQPAYQIQPPRDYVTPFFADEEEIAHNRVFNSVVSKLNGTRKHVASEEIDPTPYFGQLKFFDERNNFGFLSTVVNGAAEDIFAYGSEFDERVQFHPMFHNPKLGQHILFQFNICSYFGKYKRSRKAMNIRVVAGLDV